MELQLSRDVAAMRDDGVDGDKQMVGYLLVAHALHHCHYYILLPVRQCLGCIWVMTYHP